MDVGKSLRLVVDRMCRMLQLHNHDCSLRFTVWDGVTTFSHIMEADKFWRCEA
jgi:hypothetical protein